METKCQCPDYWFELVGGDGPCYFDECPSYSSCGGWKWDGPCGGCDDCVAAQMVHYDEYSWWYDICTEMLFWSRLQAACA